MTRLTVRRWVAAILAVLAGLAGTALWAAPAQADPVRQYQWYLAPLKIAQAQQVTRGAGVVVAVVDTPIYAAHRDLAGQLLEGTTTGGGPVNGWGGDSSGNAHGTEVTSVIVGKGGGDDHMLGIAPAAKILPVAYSAGGDGDAKTAANGIRWAADHGAKVINLSNGYTGAPVDAEVDAIRYAIAKDVVVVAGVGNTAEGMRSVISPASIPGVVAVSGVDRSGDFWSGSASGPETVIAAPGSQMSVASVSSTFPSGYGLADGTSLSTAIVSGVVALIRARYPQLNATNVINRLIRTAKDNGDPGRDRYFGFGTVRPLEALTADVPTVTENPLGAPPAASPDASSRTGAAPPAHADPGRVAILVLVAAGVLLALATVLVVAVRAGRRRSTRPAAGYPPGPAWGVPSQPYPPPGGAPPTAFGYPPGYAQPTAPPGQLPGGGTDPWNRQ
jgi:type VII secretion-associated serine protease mycosin